MQRNKVIKVLMELDALIKAAPPVNVEIPKTVVVCENGVFSYTFGERSVLLEGRFRRGHLTVTRFNDLWYITTATEPDNQLPGMHHSPAYSDVDAVIAEVVRFFKSTPKVEV